MLKDHKLTWEYCDVPQCCKGGPAATSLPTLTSSATPVSAQLPGLDQLSGFGRARPGGMGTPGCPFPMHRVMGRSRREERTQQFLLGSVRLFINNADECEEGSQARLPGEQCFRSIVWQGPSSCLHWLPGTRPQKARGCPSSLGSERQSWGLNRTP